MYSIKVQHKYKLPVEMAVMGRASSNKLLINQVSFSAVLCVQDVIDDGTVALTDAHLLELFHYVLSKCKDVLFPTLIRTGLKRTNHSKEASLTLRSTIFLGHDQ